MEVKKFVKPGAKVEPEQEFAEEFEDETEEVESVPVRPKQVQRARPSAVELVEVTKETELAWKLPSGEVVNMHGYLTWLGNMVNDMHKGLTGA